MPRSRRRLSVESLEDRALLAQLTFSTPPPQTATLNAPLGPVVVSVSGGSATVTLAVADNPGGSLLGGTVTRAITNGSVTFDDLYLYGGDPAQGVTLVASSPGDTAVVSPPFALNAGAGYLHIATPITTATAGANLGPISVQVLKTDGAVDPTDNATVVTLTLAHNPNGGRFVDATGQPLTAPPTATVSAGVATFSGIRIDRAGTGYALGAVTAARNLRHEVSPPFAVTAAAAAGLRFEAPPTYAVANLPLNTLGSVPPYAFVGVTVRVIDAFGNPTASSPGPVTVALGSNPGNSTLGGQLAVTPVNGLAVYNSLVIPNAGDGYTLTATASGLSQTATAPFNVLPAAPAKLNVLTTFPNPVPVRGKLPPVQVEVLDGNGHRLTSDNTTRVTLQPTGLLLGPTTATAVAGVATFDDLYAYGVTLDANSSAIQLQAQFTTLPFGIFTGPKITLAPGASQSLRLAQQPDNVVAGSYLTAGGQPLRVQVVDANNNVATADNTTVVALGVLQNGAHSQPTFIGNGPTAGDPSTLFGYVTATAVNGVATFPQLYINPAGVNYQLALGTRDLAFAGVSSATFTVAVGAPAKLVAIAQPTQSGSDMRVEATGQGFNGYPVKPITVALTDRVGNVIVAPNDQKTISLALTSSPDGGTLQGTTSLATVNGLAFFDGVYVKKVQPGVVGYAVQASAPGLPTPAVLPFNVADTPASAPGVFPTIAFTTQPAVTGGQIAFTVQLSAAGQPATAYDTGLGPINVYLADTNGNPLVNGPYLVGTPLGVNPVSGAASWSVRLDRGLAAATQFKIRALFAYGAVSVLSDPFTVSPGFRSSPSAAPAATPAAGPSVVPVGLGSYTNDFDTAAAFPVYGKDAGGNPKPVSQLFFPPSAQQQPGATSPPAMVQPNVAAGFDQVPQSNDWWSSVMFPRTVDPNNPDRDSNGNVLFPLFADPLTAMTNPAGTFAGLGLGYLTTRFVQPTTQYLDNAALLPPGQPRSLVDPRYPGAGAYAYRYAGSYLNDSRLYQDFSVGLAGVQADAKVLRYSDWTVTLDWAGQLQATLGRGLPFAYLTASSVPAAGTPIQLVTADPKKTTTVSAFDGSGNPVTTGTGAVHLRFSYTVQEFDPTGATNPDGSPKLVPLTISNDYGLYLPSGVAWTLDNGTLTATLTAAANYFSVAVLPDNTSASFNAYRQRAYSFVTGSTSAFSYDEATSRVTTTFRLQTQVMESGGDLLPNQPLQALYPHQTGNLPTATPLTTYTYESSKGTLKVFDGPVFTTVLTHRGTLPLVAPVPDANGYYSTLWNSYLKPFLRGVSVAGRTDGTFDLANLLPDGNNYVDAQSMLGAAQLVPLLVSVSQSADPNLTAADRGQAAVYAERVFNVVKDRMSAWLSAADDQALRLLYYQPQQPREAKATPGPGWQSLMSLAAGFESSNSLNDHHLIAGYFVKVAALIARYDSTWGDSARPVGGGQTLAGKLGDVVNQMVRDVANYDRADQPGDPSTGRPPFPFLRNFDVYQGHSWADGAANDTGGNNQESASEALNFASALIQWGEATGDVAARDLGVYLFATESDSFDTYYFNVNGTDAFPTEFTDSDPARPGVDVRPNISKLNGAGSEYGGFIGLLTSNLAGIQMLPFTGGSYYLGTNPSFVLRNYAQAMTNPTQPGAQPIVPPSYQSQLLSYLALADANKALNDPAVGFLAKRNSITPVNPGDPIDNLAFTFNWIMGLRAYGQVDPTVTADTPSFAVFTKPGGRTFVAYNPDAVPKTVTFRDATGVVFTMTVPPLTTRASDAAGATVTDQGTPDFSLEAPRNRFFFTSTGGTNGFLNGTAGAGEAAVNIPAPGQGKGPFTAPTGSNSVTFRLTGVSGTYRGGDARAFFSLWLDPQYAPSTQTAPIVRVRITYDPDGTGDPAKLVVHDYNNLPLSDNPGFAQVTSPVLIDTIKPYPAALTGGTVTVQVWGFQGNDNPIRLRTDAAAEQGRVSYLDLPYDVTAVGQPPVVGPGPGPVAPPGPTLGLTATPTVAGGRYTITLAGSVADGDAGRPRAVVVDWGDGTAPTRIPLAAGGSAFSAAHVYANNRPAGRTTITAAVEGDATGLSAVATVEVGNRPPTPAGVYTAGTGPGTPAAARLYAGGSSVPARTFAPFGDFAGGVVVATGDVTGDGVEDVVVGAGAGGGPRVVVYDGADGRTVYDFFAYAPEFRGGLGGVAVGDFDGDGYADIVTGAGAGGGPHVKAFDGRTGAEKASFFAYAPSFLGGASVAAGDVTGDGRPELLTGAGPGGGPHVRVFGWEGGGAVPVADYLAFAPDFAGGVGVAS
ncbi:MAG: hypothetical protein K2X82_06500, partial [Gemmataceae bacterium]|nr:hypothetical protein [Gemmataceae bacterium]